MKEIRGLIDLTQNEEMLHSMAEKALTASGAEEALKALAYASEKHSGQFRRKERMTDLRVPYIIHPMTVMMHAYCLGMRRDPFLAACLLHDVCEDCGVKPEELPFGSEIQHLVALLTRPQDPSLSEEEALDIYYGRIRGNADAIVIKGLDRCNNVSTMAMSYSPDKLKAYIEETEDYVIPLLDHVRELDPSCECVSFCLRYHLLSVLESLKCMIL